MRRVLVVVAFLLAFAVPVGAAPVKQYRATPHKACRSNYVKRTEKVKKRKRGRVAKVKETFCVYVAPKPPPPPAPSPITPPAPTTAPAPTSPAPPTPTPSPPTPLATTTTEAVQETGCVQSTESSALIAGHLVGFSPPAPVDVCTYAVAVTVTDQNGGSVMDGVSLDVALGTTAANAGEHVGSTACSGASCTLVVVSQPVIEPLTCPGIVGTVAAVSAGDSSDDSSSSAAATLPADSFCTS
jgi:hypothetical protein